MEPQSSGIYVFEPGVVENAFIEEFDAQDWVQSDDQPTMFFPGGESEAFSENPDPDERSGAVCAGD